MIKPHTDKRFRFGLFEIIVAGIAVVALMAFAVIFFRKTEYIPIVIRVTNSNFLYIGDNPPSWYAQALAVGSSEYDGLQQQQAVVEKTLYYPVDETHKALFLTMKVKAVYTRTKKQYSYKGRPLIVGGPIRFELQNQLVDGVILRVGKQVDTPSRELTVNARLMNDTGANSGTNGVSPYVADAVNVGDTIRDSAGTELAKITGKTVKPALRYTFPANGDILVREDPLLKDVFLTIKLKVDVINGEEYFMNVARIRVNSRVYLEMPTITIFPEIMSIER